MGYLGRRWPGSTAISVRMKVRIWCIADALPNDCVPGSRALPTTPRTASLPKDPRHEVTCDLSGGGECYGHFAMTHGAPAGYQPGARRAKPAPANAAIAAAATTATAGNAGGT